MSRWQVALERRRDPTLSERHDVSYRFAPATELQDAHHLVCVLLDVDELSDPTGPWESAIVGGRQIVTLTELLDIETVHEATR